MVEDSGPSGREVTAAARADDQMRLGEGAERGAGGGGGGVAADVSRDPDLFCGSASCAASAGFVRELIGAGASFSPSLSTLPFLLHAQVGVSWLYG